MRQAVWVGTTTTYCSQMAASFRQQRTPVQFPDQRRNYIGEPLFGRDAILPVRRQSNWPLELGRPWTASSQQFPFQLRSRFFLFAAGLGVIGLLFWRSKREATALTAS